MKRHNRQTLRHGRSVTAAVIFSLSASFSPLLRLLG
jgi:hypothetical protein